MSKLHKCEIDRTTLRAWENVSWHGVAVRRCEEDEDGNLWADNREYGNRVNYCPFCGYKAKNPATYDIKQANL